MITKIKTWKKTKDHKRNGRRYHVDVFIPTNTIERIVLEKSETKMKDYKKLEDICSIVAQYYGKSYDDLFIRQRFNVEANLRYICMYFFDKYFKFKFSTGEFADFFEKKSHASVNIGIRRVTEDMENYLELKYDVGEIDKLIQKYVLDVKEEV